MNYVFPINSLFLSESIDLIRAGDQQSYDKLIAKGFTTTQLDELVKCRASDLNKIANLDFLEIRVDSGTLDQILLHVKQNRNDEHLIQDLILNRAPGALLQEVWGLTSSDVAQLTCMLGIDRPRGRPRQVNQKDRDQIIQLWRKSGSHCSSDCSLAQRLSLRLLSVLDALDRSDLDLRHIYPIISRVEDLTHE